VRTPKLQTLFLIIALPAVGAAQGPMSPRDSAYHVLNRLAYGPRPGDVDRVAAMGVMKWIEAQLAADPGRDAALAARERQFPILRHDPADLARTFYGFQRERQRQQRDMAEGDRRPAPTPEQMEFRQMFVGFQQVVVVRGSVAEAQLYEVMADFWTNHFNVFMQKGADRFLTPSYIEETIRPGAMGKFEDLLIATAKSPAMLFYLDNAQSVAPGSSPPGLLAGRRRGGTEARPQRRPTGINENYARELMELHTLGVDGGYTQQDVMEVARIFTGWSIEPPGQGGGVGFRFNDWAHDRGAKTVLGVRFSNDGMNEGIRLLRMLAQHHATMHFVSRKLCERFVSDEPPDGCMDDAVEAWHHSNGDLRQVLRAIFRSPDFWAQRAMRSKIKTPLEFVVSAVRAVGGDPDSTPRLAQIVARLGQPLYQQAAPTGYPETQEDWVNSGALLNRMNVAMGLATGRLPGVNVNLDAITPPSTDAATLIGAIDRVLFAGTLSENTKRVISDQLSGITDPVQARALAVGLAIGGPEFQRQ
jgi:uncharacterized protein (DUF1800 family)